MRCRMVKEHNIITRFLICRPSEGTGFFLRDVLFPLAGGSDPASSAWLLRHAKSSGTKRTSENRARKTDLELRPVWVSPGCRLAKRHSRPNRRCRLQCGYKQSRRCRRYCRRRRPKSHEDWTVADSRWKAVCRSRAGFLELSMASSKAKPLTGQLIPRACFSFKFQSSDFILPAELGV